MYKGLYSYSSSMDIESMFSRGDQLTSSVTGVVAAPAPPSRAFLATIRIALDCFTLATLNALALSGADRLSPYTRVGLARDEGGDHCNPTSNRRLLHRAQSANHARNCFREKCREPLCVKPMTVCAGVANSKVVFEFLPRFAVPRRHHSLNVPFEDRGSSAGRLHL